MTELAELLRSPYADEELASGTSALLVDIQSGPVMMLDPGSLPVVIIGVGLADPMGHPECDVVLAKDDPMLPAVIATTQRHPVASTSLAVLLRASERQSVEHALASESAVYSVLQSGNEFARWRMSAPERNRAAPPDTEPAVIGRRDDDQLTIEFNRPHRHNAFSRTMRDGLTEMLAMAVLDTSITSVELLGRGPSFCSGGDLGEFGSFDSPATAHTTRLTRSPARLMHRLADRTRVRLHGNCMGAGIELPAFASRITATVDAVISLPELDLGLIPGAGGTVSLPRRIGRQRTAALALSGRRISAATALTWGLVDELV